MLGNARAHRRAKLGAGNLPKPRHQKKGAVVRRLLRAVDPAGPPCWSCLAAGKADYFLSPRTPVRTSGQPLSAQPRCRENADCKDGRDAAAIRTFPPSPQQRDQRPTWLASTGKSLIRPSASSSTAIAARISPISLVITLMPVRPRTRAIRPAAEKATKVMPPITRP